MPDQPTIPELLTTIENQVATFTINRPERRNAISADVLMQLSAGLDLVENDPNVRVVVITGAGDKAFCAGGDLGTGAVGSGAADYARLLKRILDFPKPTVARVDGYCLAGGMGLMLACDIVVASDRAQFGTPEVNVGIWPMMISALIYRNMLPKQALPMILLGDRFGAEKAMQMGFLTDVVPAADLDQTVTEITAKLAAKSPVGMKIGKNSYNTMQGMPLDEAIDYLSEQLVAIASTADAREGMTAFMEKRPPNFKGE